MSALLRSGLLDGTAVTVAAAAAGAHARAVTETCRELGAEVTELAIDPFGDPPQADSGPVLVWDGAGAFAAHTGVDAVRAALDGAWLAIRAAADLEGGKVLLVAPPSGDEHAAAARAGLENLARTLSIEWSRHGVRTLAVLAGSPRDTAQTVAYAASRAGDYFSGTALQLR